MHYPSWSFLDTITVPAWLRAGQLCLCSEDPNRQKSRVGIDCWLGDRWATSRDWTLVLQLPAIDDAVWEVNMMDRPTDTKRPVVLAVQDPRYGGFRIGKCFSEQPGRWIMYSSGKWESVHSEAVLGWLNIPHRPRRERQSLAVLQRKLKQGVLERSSDERSSELFI